MGLCKYERVASQVSGDGAGGLLAARGAGPGPAARVLTASIARRYYLDNRSKKEIAEEFGLSRFKVARLLDEARTSGLVRIEIGGPGGLDLELSDRLREHLGLRHVLVVDDPADGSVESLRQTLGRSTAQLLSETLGPSDVLGLAWGRSLSAMSQMVEQIAPCRVVQLTGALSRPDVAENSVDLVRAVARKAGGRAHAFYAPFLLPDAADAQVLRRQPEVAEAFAQFGSLTVAVLAIGSWDPPYSTVYDAVSPQDREAMRRLGVTAELSGVFVTADGATPHTELAERMIGISAAELRGVPDVLATAYGEAKAPAVRAVLRSRLLTGLVTHRGLALRLLDQPPPGDPGGGR